MVPHYIVMELIIKGYLVPLINIFLKINIKTWGKVDMKDNTFQWVGKAFMGIFEEIKY